MEDQDYGPEMYLSTAELTQAVSNFTNKTLRRSLLDITNPSWGSGLQYGYQGKQEIYVTMYRQMLERVLNTTLAVQNGIIGIRFQWYIDSAQTLQLNLRGLHESDEMRGGTPVATGELYNYLRNTDLDPLTCTVSTADIFNRLGFSTDPLHQSIAFHLIITTISGNSYFTLANKVAGNAKPNAYAPPCPPKCYPSR